ncbi:hypothetical protein [Sphingomonas montanisoli]|nr:hypothetical protein [Sphingomonas montanisoli]
MSTIPPGARPAKLSRIEKTDLAAYATGAGVIAFLPHILELLGML